MSHLRHDTVRGPVGIETDGREIVAIRVGDERPTDAPDALAMEAARQIDEFYAGTRKKLDLPFTIEGTEFEKRVVIAVTRIPYGETRTYGEIARQIGAPPQAVGQACGANPLPILIPCHRVVNKSGQLGGYGGGLWRKRILLDLEQRQQPGTAKGFVFLLLEDEHGFINVIVPPALVAANREAVRFAPFLLGNGVMVTLRFLVPSF